MSLTLLLDLDDTLLSTNINSFIPAYSKALSSAIAPYVPPETMMAAFWGGTKRMLENTDPSKTLLNVFYDHFAAQSGFDLRSIRDVIENFYDEVFPTLAPLTQKIPGAQEMVRWAFSQGYRVAIATNPLFPLKAMHHRLHWAGLPVEEYPFELVTANEEFHFAKSPAYYCELLVRLGWPEGPVVMVGDDLNWDILSPRVLGMPVFHISSDGSPVAGEPLAGAGSLADAHQWLEKADLSQFKLDLQTPQALVALLRAIPAGLAGLVANVPVEQWSRCPECEEWSLNEILCHLRDVEIEVNIPRLRTLLEETNPFIAAKVTDDWVLERQYDRQDGHEALLVLVSARKQLVDLLASLSEEDWKRPARHSIFGPTDLRELVSFIAEHDRSHIQQVYKTIKATN